MSNIFLPFSNEYDLKLVFIFQDYLNSHQNLSKFNDCKIHSIYGTFPKAIWNGGRTLNNDIDYSKEKIEYFLNIINHRNLGCRMTFTNQLIQPCHLNDNYCNYILNKVVSYPNNGIIINNKCLEEYIKKLYPNVFLISSITKGNDFNTFYKAINDDYNMIVIYPKKNILNYAMQNKIFQNKIEILLDTQCAFCPQISIHQGKESYYNLYQCLPQPFKCYKQILFEQNLSENIPMEEQLIIEPKILEYLGFSNFKFQGRGDPVPGLIKKFSRDLFKEQYVHNIINEIEYIYNHTSLKDYQLYI